VRKVFSRGEGSLTPEGRVYPQRTAYTNRVNDQLVNVIKLLIKLHITEKNNLDKLHKFNFTLF